jgi:hypothetical protein
MGKESSRAIDPAGNETTWPDDTNKFRTRSQKRPRPHHSGSIAGEHLSVGIEGFKANLIYSPEGRIAVVVLGNVNGGAPGEMGEPLFDVVLGKPVVLASEHKAVPIVKEELAKFVGVYDLAPTFSLTVAIAGDSLTVQGTNQSALAVMYQGLKDGHPTFYLPQPNAEIEFGPMRLARSLR